MRLGVLAKSRVRAAVGLVGELQAQKRHASEQIRERASVLNALKGMHGKAARELDEFKKSASGAIWSPGAREREGQRLTEHVAELAGRVAELEAELERLRAGEKAIDPDLRAARQIAEGLVRMLDHQEQLLRDELGWYEQGANPPRALERG